MEEKLQKKKTLLRLLGFAIVIIAVIASFLPIYKITKTVETLGIQESITAEFNIWQILIQDKEIALTSSSALGEIENFKTASMVNLLGGETIAFITTVALIVLGTTFVIYGAILLFTSYLLAPQRGAIKIFLISFLLFTVFPIFILTKTQETTEYITTIPIVFIIVTAVVTFAIMDLFDKLSTSIEIISAEILVQKYKNENKDWYRAFIKDIMDYFNNAGIPVGVDGFVRFLDAYDRSELRNKEEKQ